MKYIIIFALLLVGCYSPIKVVETYTTDKDGKTVKTITKTYDSTRSTSSTVFVDNSTYWNDPFYNNFIYGYGFYPRTRVVVPITTYRRPVRPLYTPLPPGPRQHYNPSPRSHSVPPIRTFPNRR
jgi:hypothetical protein